jgi:hypothetical protein
MDLTTDLAQDRRCGPFPPLTTRHRFTGPLESQLISVPYLYRAPTRVALRIARETYETAALPLSYVGPEGEYR